MYIKDIFKEKKPVISFEIFPPKKESNIKTIYKTIDELAQLNPDYISVTYGASGSIKNNKTVEISSFIKREYKIEPLSHLTCINSSKKEIDEILNQLIENNISNVLALRGDIPNDKNIKKEFNYAEDLIRYISKKKKFSIGAACYPEGHIEARNKSLDLYYLNKKVNAGTDFLITQLFFDNKYFYDFREKLKNRNINIPLQAGIMPVVNKKQVEKIVSMCGVNIPEKFIKIMNKYENNKEALIDAGVTYACDQIIDLLTTGVDGIHLYVMNKSKIAKEIVKRITSILKINIKMEE
ncbi:methylenetetrahydrofolate reductase [Tepiditoga spiralis]|uniref:Methylenetetrahydrofolate reductase n=1 Tax=Tepiditoga spiralis TaxID=2108365 RepID=A0A7G1G4W3_9BACT|nr:methylenetetrahydrofolate reductase [NAD(P)H] [Tepiditoga spiralis]BBE30276.1 methylenetetrahydrofolate reductase [Tepiditoga spiralis]